MESATSVPFLDHLNGSRVKAGHGWQSIEVFRAELIRHGGRGSSVAFHSHTEAMQAARQQIMESSLLGIKEGRRAGALLVVGVNHGRLRVHGLAGEAAGQGSSFSIRPARRWRVCMCLGQGRRGRRASLHD